MGNTWFRMYDDVVDDPKVQRLPDRLFKGWVNCMCIASKHGGCLPSVEEVAYRLRLTKPRTEQLLLELQQLGLLDNSECGALEPHNWKGRQFQSDMSRDRMRRLRDRHRDGEQTVTKPSQSPSPDRHGDAAEQNRTEQSRTEEGSKDPSVERHKMSRPRDAAVDAFCDTFSELNAPAKYLARKADFVQLAALRKVQGVEVLGAPPGWLQACRNYCASPISRPTLADLCNRYSVFLKGGTDRYGVPIGTTNGNGKHEFESKAESIVRKNREEVERFRRALHGPVGDSVGASGDSGTDRPVLPGIVGPD